MAEYYLKITRASNGYILSWDEEIETADENHPLIETQEWLIESSEGDELREHERLLWEVMEFFGFGGSKHDEERLRITREKRDD